MTNYTISKKTSTTNNSSSSTKSSTSMTETATSVDTTNATTIDLSKETGDTVEITKAGTYILTGTYTGQIHILADKAEVTIVLKNAKITSNNGPAFYSEDAKLTTISLEGTNTLTDSTNYTTTDGAPDATLYADDDLTLTGSGSLTINATYQKAIRTKDVLTIDSGSYKISAETDGVKGTDGIVINGGTIDITSGSDGIQASGTDSDQGNLTINGGTITVAAGKDGIKAENTLTVNDGEITVTDAYEAFEAAIINIAGGTIKTHSTDDGLNASSETISPEINISGGTLSIYAGLSSQGDGLDSNGTITISGGEITIYDPENAGDWSSVDSDDGTTLTGGTVYKVDSSGSKTELTEDTISEEMGPGGGQGGPGGFK